MATAIVRSKGQITIPASVRAALGLAAGDRVEFVELEHGGFTIVSAAQPVQRLKGMISKPGQAVSIDDMNAAIAGCGASTR